MLVQAFKRIGFLDTRRLDGQMKASADIFTDLLDRGLGIEMGKVDRKIKVVEVKLKPI